MECKGDSYVVGSGGDIFDIPAAEQEITVGSNEQLSSGIGCSLVQNVSMDPQMTLIQPPVSTFRMAYPAPTRGPRVIMLQRTSQPGIVSNLNPVRQNLKAFKIITVPGQGVGGKPLRAAVIPMHMLQRRLKMVSDGETQNFGNVISSANLSPSMPRLLAFRPANQVGAPVTGNFTIVSAAANQMRPGTFILSGGPRGNLSRAAHGYPVNSGEDEGMENLVMGPGGDGGYLHRQHPSGTYLELSGTHPGHFVLPPSPSGRESDGEADHMTSGLKTNGLRRYARCVCNKVKDKGITSYSEVADELVHEYAAEHPMIPSEQLHYIQKNIRRRVYDALNVLMALNVLQKEKKEIRWVGLPVNMIEECRRLEEERERRQISLRNKTAEIQELILQLIAFKSLVLRNRLNERCKRQSFSETGTTASQLETEQKVSTAESSLGPMIGDLADRVGLPFLLVSTNRKAIVDCNISNDKLEYLFNFDQAFEIRDEVEVLKRLGFTLRLGSAQCTQEEYNQCLELVPPSLRFYVEAIYERRQAIVPDFDALHQQRRLFVEARLSAVSVGASTSGEEACDDGTLRSSQASLALRHHPSVGSTSLASHFALFDVSALEEEPGIRQIQLQRGSPAVSGLPVDLVPGDTQHYARTAASRGLVVPGGPGGLLRHHRQAAGQFKGQAGVIHRQAVRMTVEGCDARRLGMGDRQSASGTDLLQASHRLEDEVLMEEDEEEDDDDDMEEQA